MKYPKEYLDEIKTRLKVSSVVSKVVALKKRGKEFVGLSPFKNEKTPSFTVTSCAAAVKLNVKVVSQIKLHKPLRPTTIAKLLKF